VSVQRKPNGYRVMWREDGRQRSRGFDRKRDAEAWDAEVKRRRQLGPLAVAQLTERGPTLGEWIAQRWAPEHGATLAKRTRRGYGSDYDLHIAPWLDDVPIRDLTVSRLRAWQAGRVAAGTSTETIRRARVVLSSVLRHAAESEAIAGNPLSLVRAPRAEYREEVVALAPATVEAIRPAPTAARGPPRTGATGAAGRGAPRASGPASTPCRAPTTCATASPRCCWLRRAPCTTSPASSGTRPS
jgi:hypothetical protein